MVARLATARGVGDEVDGAVRGIAAPIDTEPTQGRGQAHPAAEFAGQIVVVRQQVVDNVGHVLGNLFQRIYHLIDLCSVTDAAAAAELERGARQLDDFLQLVLDYFSPIEPALQAVSAVEIAQSFARHLSDTTNCSVKIDAKLPNESRVLVDPGRLRRSFTLLASRLQVPADHREPTEAKVVGHTRGRTMTLTATMPRSFVLNPSTEAEIRWAVAERFLEIHGGSVHEELVPSGEVLWEIALPLQR